MANEIVMLDEPETALTVVQRAEVALNAKQARIDLAAQVKKSENVGEIKNAAGREEAHSYAMGLVRSRTTLQKVGKAKREDATAFSKAVIALENELLQITTPEETRLLALRDKWDADRAAEKAEADRLERVRIETITLRIADIRDAATVALKTLDSTAVQELIDKMDTAQITEAVYGEFIGEALATKVSTLARMREIFAAKKAAEDEAARVKAEQEAERVRLAAERAELERLRAEAAERERIAALERARFDAAAKVERDAAETLAQRKREEAAAEVARQRAENERVAAANKAEAERLESIRREQEAAKLKAEQDAREKAEREAKAAADKAALAAQQARQPAVAPTVAPAQPEPVAAASAPVAIRAKTTLAAPEWVIERTPQDERTRIISMIQDLNLEELQMVRQFIADRAWDVATA